MAGVGTGVLATSLVPLLIALVDTHGSGRVSIVVSKILPALVTMFALLSCVLDCSVQQGV